MQSLSVKRSTVGLQEGIDVGKVTLTIADRDGVSRTTVSNAFSRPDQLSEELLHRIRAVANELSYGGPTRWLAACAPDVPA
jgi:hypothetical protein